MSGVALVAAPIQVRMAGDAFRGGESGVVSDNDVDEVTEDDSSQAPAMFRKPGEEFTMREVLCVRLCMTLRSMVRPRSVLTSYINFS